jgi:hypothetical protein
MVYPILYPFGGGGWSTSLEGKYSSNRVMLLNYYSYILSVRKTFSSFLQAGKLSQQFIVDAYTKIEAQRLEYLRKNQKNLRVEQYQGLHDYIRGRSEGDNYQVGKAIILPSSFQGSPRNMAQNYQDAMAMVSRFGRPDLFVTFTCNPNWPEIRENLDYCRAPNERPDLVTRIFKHKLQAMLHEFVDDGILGDVKAYTYVVEWQKRGLPHAHILLILDEKSKIRSPIDIDRIVCAEIPSSLAEPELFTVVQNCIRITGHVGTIINMRPAWRTVFAQNGTPNSFAKILFLV